MRVAEVERFEGVGGIETVLRGCGNVWKSLERKSADSRQFRDDSKTGKEMCRSLPVERTRGTWLLPLPGKAIVSAHARAMETAHC